MSDDNTARVNMVWPAELKDRVRDKVGARGLTEFVTEAVDLHLKGSADTLAALEKELNETKNLAQLLADRTVMGGSNVDRLEAFMELELPPWMDTSGWPSQFAERVHPEALAEVDRNARAYGWEVGNGQEAADVVQVSEGNPFVPELPPEAVREVPTLAPEPEAEVEVEVEPMGPADFPDNDQNPEKPEPSPQESEADDFFADKVKGNDLFAKVMAATGGDPLMEQLKPASEIPQPEPVEQKDLCPNCGDEMVNGECWSC